MGGPFAETSSRCAGLLLLATTTVACSDPALDHAATGADTPTPSSSLVDCDACELVRTLEVTFGDLDEPGMVNEQISVAQGPDGRIYVPSLMASGAVKVFSAEGSFQEQFRRHGEGPGEFSGGLGVFPNADRVTVIDRFARRITRLTLRFELIDTRAMPVSAFQSIARLDPQRFVFGVVSRGTQGELHHLYDTVVEVLDPESGRVVAFGGFPDLFRLLEPGRAIQYVEDDVGNPSYRIWRLEAETR